MRYNISQIVCVSFLAALSIVSTARGHQVPTPPKPSSSQGNTQAEKKTTNKGEENPSNSSTETPTTKSDGSKAQEESTSKSPQAETESVENTTQSSLIVGAIGALAGLLLGFGGAFLVTRTNVRDPKSNEDDREFNVRPLDVLDVRHELKPIREILTQQSAAFVTTLQPILQREMQGVNSTLVSQLGVLTIQLDGLQNGLRSLDQTAKELEATQSRKVDLEVELEKSNTDHFNELKHSRPTHDEAEEQLRDLLPKLSGRVGIFTRDILSLAFDIEKTQDVHILAKDRLNAIDAVIFGTIPAANRNALEEPIPTEDVQYLPTLLQTMQIGLAKRLKEKHRFVAYTGRVGEKINPDQFDLTRDTVQVGQRDQHDTVDITTRLGYMINGVPVRKAVVRRRIYTGGDMEEAQEGSK